MTQVNLARVGSKIHELEFEKSARICPCTSRLITVPRLPNVWYTREKEFFEISENCSKNIGNVGYLIDIKIPVTLYF